MYKKQMTAQRIVCMAAVIVSAIFFLYTLGIMTDLYDSLYDTMRNPNNIWDTDVSGSIVYYNMQDFNRTFLLYSIGQILLACLLFLTSTHTTSATMYPPPCSWRAAFITPCSPTATLRFSRPSSSRWTSPR